MTEDKPYTPIAQPRNSIEARAQQQVLYGFRTQGAHCEMMEELLGNAYETCPRCGGSGFYGTYGGMGWRYCPDCRGVGRVLAISQEEFEKRRRVIIDRFPGSAIANWQPFRPIRLPIVDLSTGIVLEADYPEPQFEQLELAI